MAARLLSIKGDTLGGMIQYYLLLLLSSLPTLSLSDQQLYADLPGCRASESPPSTIPANIISTIYCPDIVLCNGKKHQILELTVCSNTPEGIDSARVRKQSKKCTYLY